MFQCDQCYLSSQKYYATLDELEIHLAIDHYNLIIYECFLCPYAKFPTETTLVDHYRCTHSITSSMKINYTLDHSAIVVRRNIQHSLSKSTSSLKSIIQLNSNLIDESLSDSCNADILWIPSKETFSDKKILDTTIQNFSPQSTGELPSPQDSLERKVITDTCSNSSQINYTNSFSTPLLKKSQYSTKSCTPEFYQVDVGKRKPKKPMTLTCDNDLPKLNDGKQSTETTLLSREVHVPLKHSSKCSECSNAHCE